VALLALIGVAAGGDALTRAPEPPPAAAESPPAEAAGAGPSPEALQALRSRFAELLNGERVRLGLAPVEADPALERAAQAHVEPLADRVQAALEGIGSYRGVDAGLVYRKVGQGRVEPRRSGIGHAIVLDAATPEGALEAALALDRSADLLESGYRRLGVGVARGELDGMPRTGWVAVLLRR
jgi:hypothetical protein